jgi:modulator of FtsH protease
MMRAYDPAAWVPFFTAMIAAAAGLTGLLFVAVSINLDRILKAARFLPARAAETLATLLLVVVSSALALIPQSTRLLGLELVIVVVPMRDHSPEPAEPPAPEPGRPAVVDRLPDGGHRRGHRSVHRGRILARLAWWRGVLLACPAALLGTVGAVYNAWVLLVEIVR